MAEELKILADVMEVEGRASGNTHCLLGNGFSRAIFNDIFSYDALLEEVDFSSLSKKSRKAFDFLGTTDFEEVIRALRSSAQLLRLSAKDYASLVGVSMLTIYNWEKGKSKPQAKALAGWAAVRGIGKREAWRRLELLEG